MFSICKGVLTMCSVDLDHIQGRIDEEGNTPREALANELEFCGLNIEDIFDIELSGFLMGNPKYLELYSKIVTDCWNNK